MTPTAAVGEAKGLGWMATCSLRYAISAMIASTVNLVTLALPDSGAGGGAILAAISLTALVGGVGWLMALPALVTLAVGLYELGRSGVDPPKEVRLRWLMLGAGIGLFVITVPLLVLATLSRTVNTTLELLQTAVGLASALVLLYVAALPALRRGPASWGAPARLVLLLGLVAAVVEAVAAVANRVSPGLPVLSNWPPVAWGFPASFIVLASAAALWWTYASLMKAAKTPAPGSGARGITGAP